MTILFSSFCFVMFLLLYQKLFFSKSHGENSCKCKGVSRGSGLPYNVIIKKPKTKQKLFSCSTPLMHKGTHLKTIKGNMICFFAGKFSFSCFVFPIVFVSLHIIICRLIISNEKGGGMSKCMVNTD